MVGRLKRIARRILGVTDLSEGGFISFDYYRHNQRRLEHLATLGLDIAGAGVLEVGAGIGDHTSFFLDRGCRVVSSDARPENVAVLRSRFPGLAVLTLDLDHPDPATLGQTFDIVYCYGLLYHLERPAEALAFMARHCRKLLLLETCVSGGDSPAIHACDEPKDNRTQAYSGQGCRPTRPWVFAQLKRLFEFVYVPLTQPNHVEFPTDWCSSPTTPLTRSVFIAARQRLTNTLLVEELPMQQRRAG